MNEQLRQQLNTLISNLNGRSRPEKGLILSIVLAGLVMLYLTVAYDPLKADIASLEGQIRSATNQISSQQQAYTALLARSQQDPNKATNDRLAVLVREQALLDQDIDNLAGDLVTPDEMTTILTSVLGQFNGLELLLFSNEEAVPLRDDLASAPEPDAEGRDAVDSSDSGISGQVYSHGLTIEFEGDFFSTLQYLRFLEDVSGSFFWDSINFKQTEWPTAHVSLQIHTLSTDEGFIGV